MVEQDTSYSDLLEELKAEKNECEIILNKLIPLTKEGEVYKELFSDIWEEITKVYEESQKITSEISKAKTSNTKYFNDLDKNRKQLDLFIKESKTTINSLENIVSKISKIEGRAESKSNSINNLREYSEENKKLITEYKNDSKKYLESIERIKSDCEDFRKQSKTLLDNIKDKLKSSSLSLDKITEIEKKSEQLSDKIRMKYNSLFVDKNSENLTKIQELENNIKKWEEYNSRLEEEIQLFEEQWMSNAEALAKTEELQRQSEELLSNVTKWGLFEGYSQAMGKYSTPIKKEYIDFNSSFTVKNIWISITNIGRFFYNIIFRYYKDIINYTIFIWPLVFIGTSFSTDIITAYIKEINELLNIKPGFSELLLLKGIMTLPLLAISWFWYWSIVQKKKLFEEYHHKARVVQMYTMFKTETNIKWLDDYKDIEKEVISTISDNPSKFIGKNWSLIDDVMRKIYSWNTLDKIKKEIKEDLSKKDNKNTN